MTSSERIEVWQSLPKQMEEEACLPKTGQVKKYNLVVPHIGNVGGGKKIQDLHGSGIEKQ